MKSLLVCAAASAVLVTAPVAVVPAQAATPTTHAAVAKPSRTVGAKVVKVRGHLVMTGHVGGGYTNHVVIIQKKNCLPKRCAWHTFAKTRTNNLDRYRQRITAPRTGSWYWRAKVSETPKFATSYSAVWRTYRV